MTFPNLTTMGIALIEVNFSLAVEQGRTENLAGLDVKRGHVMDL